MTRLIDYQGRYEDVALERREGILEVRLHTDGGPLQWTERSHRELGDAFYDIANDPDNRVVILTGTGDSFLTDFAFADEERARTPSQWDKVVREGRRLIWGLLAIDVPVIAAVNGPATEHAEIAVLSDIVLASNTSYFQDRPHFRSGVVPGDGVHAIWPALLGPNRGRYFLLTGQIITAEEALDLGVVNEVLAHDDVLPRAWDLAEELATRTTLTLRHTRRCLTMVLRRLLQDTLEPGLALEGLAILDMRMTQE